METIIILSAWLLFTFYGCIVCYIAKDYHNQSVKQLNYSGIFYATQVKLEPAYNPIKLLAPVLQPLLLDVVKFYPITIKQNYMKHYFFISDDPGNLYPMVDDNWIDNHFTKHPTKYDHNSKTTYYEELFPAEIIVNRNETTSLTMTIKINDCQKDIKGIDKAIKTLFDDKQQKFKFSFPVHNESRIETWPDNFEPHIDIFHDDKKVISLNGNYKPGLIKKAMSGLDSKQTNILKEANKIVKSKGVRKQKVLAEVLS